MFVGAALNAGCVNTDIPEEAFVPETVDEFARSCLESSRFFTSQEAFEAIKQAEADGLVVTDDAKAVRLNAPARTSGALSDSRSPTFIFTAPTVAARGAGAHTWWASMRDAVGAFFSIPQAHAQPSCAPVTGENYLFRVWDRRARNSNRSTAETPLLSAMLSVTTYTPSSALWREAVGRRLPEIEIEVIRARFEAGTIVEGPYRASSLPSFEVVPDSALE